MAKKQQTMPARKNGNDLKHAATPPAIPEPTIEKRKIADLKRHPLQSKYHTDLDQAGIKRLAASIARKLDKHPEILPDGTLIDGHQRVRAADILGWEEIDVVVRHDLAAQGAEAVEARLLEDNDRRHDTPLQRARCLVRRQELAQAKAKDWKAVPAHFNTSARDLIGQELGMSGRHLARYLNLLKAPLSVQQAFDHGMLSIDMAARVAGLSEEVQQQIAEQIEAGGDAKSAVKPHLAKKTGKRQKIRAFRSIFLRRLDQLVADVHDRLEEITSMPSDGRAIVDKACAVLEQLRKIPPSKIRSVEELVKELSKCG